jgi:hypothetical protein
MGLAEVTPRIYFFCREHPVVYQDGVVALADGLQRLGAEVYGNVNYWRRSPAPEDWLVRADPQVQPADCDIVVLTNGWSQGIDSAFHIHEAPLPPALFTPGRRYRTAYLDLADGYLTPSWAPEFAAFDVVFRAHYNRRCFHPDNHRPWVLGLNSRVIAATTEAVKWNERQRSLLINFGASHPYAHGVRSKAGPQLINASRNQFEIDDRRDDLRVAPDDAYDRLMWEQTQHRHCRAYYHRLCSSQAIAAFCGELIPPAPRYPRYLVGGRRARIERAWFAALSRFDRRPPRLIQWDSWRFWEGMAAGCLVFSLDLPHYGVELPVMPRPMEHYVPVRLENMDAVLAQLAREPGRAEHIAAQGRAWALEHYSPRALAQRFLEAMGISEPIARGSNSAS